MHTQTQAHTHTPANVNPGILAMRAALERKRANPSAFTPKTPAKPRVSARKPAPAKAPAADAPETPEDLREYRVCVLVQAGDAQTHVWVGVNAAGPRRASGQARAEARKAGHEPVGVCAILRDDAPQALLALAV